MPPIGAISHRTAGYRSRTLGWLAVPTLPKQAVCVAPADSMAQNLLDVPEMSWNSRRPMKLTPEGLHV